MVLRSTSTCVRVVAKVSSTIIGGEARKLRVKSTCEIRIGSPASSLTDMTSHTASLQIASTSHWPAIITGRTVNTHVTILISACRTGLSSGTSSSAHKVVRTRPSDTKSLSRTKRISRTVNAGCLFIGGVVSTNRTFQLDVASFSTISASSTGNRVIIHVRKTSSAD